MTLWQMQQVFDRQRVELDLPASALMLTRSLAPSTLIHDTLHHSGRCPATKRSMSSIVRVSTLSGLKLMTVTLTSPLDDGSSLNCSLSSPAGVPGRSLLMRGRRRPPGIRTTARILKLRPGGRQGSW